MLLLAHERQQQHGVLLPSILMYNDQITDHLSEVRKSYQSPVPRASPKNGAFFLLFLNIYLCMCCLGWGAHVCGPCGGQKNTLVSSSITFHLFFQEGSFLAPALLFSWLETGKSQGSSCWC